MIHILSLFLLCYSALSVARTSVGIIGVSAGEVTVDQKPVNDGDSLFSGQTVETEEGKVKLLFVDDTVVDLGNFSSFFVEKYVIDPRRDVKLELKKGKARTAIHEKLRREGRFTLKTRTSVLAVRGTEFLAAVDISGDEVREQYTVGDGELDRRPLVGDKSAVSRLRPGNQLSTFASFVNGNLVPDPSRAANGGKMVSLPASEVLSLLNSNTVEEKSLDTLSDVEGDALAPSEDSKAPPPDANQNRSFFNIQVTPIDPKGLETGDRSVGKVEVQVGYTPTP